MLYCFLVCLVISSLLIYGCLKETPNELAMESNEKSIEISFFLIEKEDWDIYKNNKNNEIINSWNKIKVIYDS